VEHSAGIGDRGSGIGARGSGLGARKGLVAGVQQASGPRDQVWSRLWVLVL
jgi:hypothetical protein